MSYTYRPRMTFTEDSDTFAFKVDVVYFRSGGPGMTVTAATGNVVIECTWFTHADDRYKAHSFKPELLVVR